MRGCVCISLLYTFALFRCLYGDLYLEHENEETISRRCRPDLGCFPSQLEFAKLKNSMTGELVWSGDANYTHYNWQINYAHWKYPIVHAMCKNVEDIQMVVRFAKKHNLHVTIKSGGRELWGKSSENSGFTINLMEMKDISINSNPTDRSEYGEITVQTGVTAKAIYDKVEEHGRIVLLEKEGLGLHISTGGLGYLSPALGLGVDSVLEIKVVLADGRLATCTHDKTIIEDDEGSETRNDGELFWALRGGGGGTFGVVVHYVLRLQQAPNSFVLATITGLLNESHAEILKESIDLYDEWVRIAPTHWGGIIGFYNGFFVVRLIKFGLWDGEIESELSPFLEFHSRYNNLLIKDIRNVSSSEDAVHYGYPPVRSYATGAFIPPEKHIAPGLRDLLVEEVMDASNGRLTCHFMRLRGKVAEYGKDTSSVHPGFRRAQSHLGCFFNAGWDHKLSSIQQQEHIQAKTAQFAKKLRPFQDGQNLHIGYIPSPDWKMDFWGENYVELLKVKIRYDPDNLFTCYHCVGSDRTDSHIYEPTSAVARETWYFVHVFLLLLIARIVKG